MAISLIRTTLLSITSAALLIGCASTPYSPAPFTPANMDASAYNPKVDAFVVVMDASSSMEYSGDQDRKKFHSAKDVVSHMNQTIPELNYKSALVGFGSNSCLNWEKAMVAYGPAIYQTADFSNGLNMLECAGGVSPMEDGVYAGGSTVQGSGQIALILVSDFLAIDSDAVIAKVDALEAEHGDRLCIHTITVGGAEQGELTAALANVNSCGSSVNAESLTSSAAMAGYVADMLLEPAPAAPVVNYEKSTISASALFDYDSSDLKEEGKVAMSDLKKSIKARDTSVVSIDVIGHTDNTGSEEYNMDLSIRRAEAVREYMVSHGVDASKINVYGEGESNPAASNETKDGRAENRRVDIHVGITD